MKIKILGSGCPQCRQMENATVTGMKKRHATALERKAGDRCAYPRR